MTEFLIEKKVHQFSYWYNDDINRWEGLKSNATIFTDRKRAEDVIISRRLFEAEVVIK